MLSLKGRKEEGWESRIMSSSTQSGSNLTAFIDQGSEFEGKLTFRDTVRIDGRFAGEIASENTLVVGESGQIEAMVRSRNVIVSGSIQGDIHAADRLTLHKTARVDGDVEVGCIAVEEGAVLNGRVTMPNSKPKSTPAPLSDDPINQGT